MAIINDSDILVTKKESDILLDLECGFGQPSVTTVYYHKNNGSTIKLSEFEGNTSELILGKHSELRFGVIEIHTTIRDERVIVPDKDEEDISLTVKVYQDKDTAVDTRFRRKTTGKGAIFNSFYEVTVI